MENTLIRPLLRQDIPQLIRLVSSREELDESSAARRVEIMSWLAFHNPFAGKETTYYVAEDNGRIVAFQGRMPVQMIVEGKTVRGYYPHDLYVDPESRKTGRGFWLSMALGDVIDRESDALVCHFGMTPLNTAIQRKRGYFETNTLGFYKVINSDFQLKKRLNNKVLASFLIPLVNLFVNSIDKPVGLFSKKLKVIPIERFDDRFDQLAERNKSFLGISTLRSAAYLNWKYIDRPFKRDKILAIEENDQIKGYVVLFKSAVSNENEEVVGTILDIMADKGEERLIKQLLKIAVTYFRSVGVHGVKCVLTDPRYIKAIKKFFFMEFPGKTVMLGNGNGALDAFDKEKIKDIDRWHLTLSEGDSNMFRF